MFESFSEIGTANILAVDIVSGVISFFVVAVGGTVIGKGYILATFTFYKA